VSWATLAEHVALAVGSQSTVDVLFTDGTDIASKSAGDEGGTMPFTIDKQWMKGGAAVAICIAAIAYLIYSGVTETGLAGYVIQLQMALVGRASSDITWIVTILGPCLVLWAGIQLAYRLNLLKRPETKSAPAPRVIPAVPGPVPRSFLKVAAIAAAIPLAICGIVVAAMSYAAWRDRSEPVYSLDLSSPGATLPRSARYVEVAGLLDLRHAAAFKKTEDQTVDREFYAPLVDPGRSDPVRFVLYHSEREAATGEVQWPAVFRSRGIATFSGKVAGRVPVYVESKFRAAGVKLAPSYTVIEYRELVNHQPPPVNRDDMYLAVWVGGLISVAVFVSILAMGRMVARLRRQASARAAAADFGR
jgi:hypothetical protein